MRTYKEHKTYTAFLNFMLTLSGAAFFLSTVFLVVAIGLTDASDVVMKAELDALVNDIAFPLIISSSLFCIFTILRCVEHLKWEHKRTSYIRHIASRRWER